MSITSRAIVALDLTRRAGLPLDDPATTPPTIRRTRARIARHVGALLGVDPGHVHVGGDPARGMIEPGHLVTVHDPDRPDAPPLRLIPETGDEELFLLLGPCPMCDHEVPVAPIGGLVDLALHRERHGVAPDDRPDDWPGPVPLEFDLDPGHARDCALRAH